MKKYEILRQCLWFAQSEFIPFEKFQKYFTPAAVKSLLDEGYIKVHF